MVQPQRRRTACQAVGVLSTVAVLSDVHGVLPALEAVLAEPAVARADLVVVTGDHTWGPQPAEVLDRLRGLGAAVQLVRDVVAGSSWPGVAPWAEETLRRPAGDVEALTTFGPRYGR